MASEPTSSVPAIDPKLITLQSLSRFCRDAEAEVLKTALCASLDRYFAHELTAAAALNVFMLGFTCFSPKLVKKPHKLSDEEKLEQM